MKRITIQTGRVRNLAPVAMVKPCGGYMQTRGANFMPDQSDILAFLYLQAASIGDLALITVHLQNTNAAGFHTTVIVPKARVLPTHYAQSFLKPGKHCAYVGSLRILGPVPATSFGVESVGWACDREQMKLWAGGHLCGAHKARRMGRKKVVFTIFKEYRNPDNGHHSSVTI
jgi:hypothetical protein